MAKMKLAILPFLCCGEIVKNLFNPLLHYSPVSSYDFSYGIIQHYIQIGPIFESESISFSSVMHSTNVLHSYCICHQYYVW